MSRLHILSWPLCQLRPALTSSLHVLSVCEGVGGVSCRVLGDRRRHRPALRLIPQVVGRRQPRCLCAC